MPDSQQKYVRKFKDVMHLAIMRGAPGIDMKQDILAYMLAGVAASHKDAKNDRTEQVEIQAFWPLNSTNVCQELFWVEHYPNLREWAEAELISQRSEQWISSRIALSRSGILESSYAEMMVEDTLDYAPRLKPKPGDPLIGVNLIQLRSTSILPNLIELPAHVRKLNRILRSAGFNSFSPKYFTAPTSAGSDRENAWIWIEYPSVVDMVGALTYLVSDSEAAAWRKELVSITKIQAQHLLVQAVLEP